MRPDMFKVITETTRLNPNSIRRGRQADLDDLPQHESMRKNYIRRDSNKFSRQHLAPLFRWLDKQVGKSWNDVWSEICSSDVAAIHKDLRWHIDHIVERHVMIDHDDIPFHPGSANPIALFAAFWVHPETGILFRTDRQAITSKRLERQQNAVAERAQKELILGPERHYKVFDNVWYQLIFADRPIALHETHTRFDGTVENRSWLPPVTDLRTIANVPESQRRYAKAKRQLSSKELAALGLINGTPAPKRRRH